MTAKPKPIDQLVWAMGRCAIARGEAQWTQGYRTGHVGGSLDVHLHAKEQAQWKRVGAVEKAFRRLALQLLRDAGRRGKQ